MSKASDNRVTLLVRRAEDGDHEALGELVEIYRPRLIRMVQQRLDRRLRGRVSPSDILQEVYLEIARRLPTNSLPGRPSFFQWLRLVTAQQLLQAHRRHLGTAKRDARRECHVNPAGAPAASTPSLADQLPDRLPSPSQAALRVELRENLQAILDMLDPIDRNILTLRHFEELTNQEVAETLRLSKATASKRYVQALRRLGRLLATLGTPLDPS
ncbi:MAG: sigma-70 family RNA polymerase sigma factor [Pirellulaceae bacterium]